MNKKIIAFLAIWHFFALNFSVAQTVKSISGKLVSVNARPVIATPVTLYLQKDSSLVKMALTDSMGFFQFQPLKEGVFYLEVDAIRYAFYRSNLLVLDSIHTVSDAGAISLKDTKGPMKEVEVVAKKSMIVRLPDRTVVNVDALTSAAGTTALDVLEKSPGVQVDQNGVITLRGKQGVNIYIDDKPSYLSGEDLANYLRSLPSSALDQIELMTNPPAKYDAAGSAGIINLKIKRSKNKGMNGGLNLSIGAGKLVRSNNSGNFNYRNNKVSIFANVGYGLSNNFTDLELNRVYKNVNNAPTAYFEQNSYFRRYGNSGMLNAGIDYYLSERSALGMVVNGMARGGKSVNDNVSHLLNANRNPDSTIVARNEDRNNFKNGSMNLNYRTKFDDKGHGFSADADWLSYRSQTDQVYHNMSFLPDQTLRSEDTLKGNLPGHIDIYSIKADYTLPTILKTQVAAGLKYSNTQTNNTADYKTIVDGVTSQDYTKSNQFIYKESISAAYINLNREIGALSVQAGLRMEHTNSTGHQLGNIMQPDSSFKRDYTNLFPTLYLTYKFDTLANHQMGLNYGRRIERPYYEDLNPFLYPMDKFTYYSGNPFLRPAFAQSLELSYTYKNKITTTLSYSKFKDNVNETIEINNGIYYSRPGNIGRKTYKSISVDATLDPAKWASVHLYTEFTNIAAKSDFYNGTLNTSGSFWFINANVHITPAKSWDIELSGDYRTRIFDAQFITAPFWQANVAVQKKMGKHITLKLSANDIFYQRIIIGTITNLSMAEAGWVNKSDSRNVIFTFSYRFGKAFNTDRKHEANGADAERSRVKN